MSIRLSADHKTIYVTTIDHNGIEVVDVATRKVTNHFVLNTATKQYRFRGGAVDTQGRFFYTVSNGNRRVAGTLRGGQAEIYGHRLGAAEDSQDGGVPAEDQLANRLSFEVSPDGKYLYQFGSKITILQTSDFKVVDQLDLAQPDGGGMENVHLGGDLDSISQPGVHMSLFTSSDPIVHNRVFGLARLDLATREVNYNPIGPAPSGMAGLQVTPDKKLAYTVVANGQFGNKSCEFWGFDLATDRLIRRRRGPLQDAI